MIFGNSDPAFFALFVSAELEQGRDATRLLERLRAEFWDRWLRPPLAALFGRPTPRRRSRPLARPYSGFRPADFEVLAAFPVDRANPPASLAARLRHLRQLRQWRNPGRKVGIAVTERELPSPPLFVRRGEGTTATTTPPLSSPNGAEDDHPVPGHTRSLVMHARLRRVAFLAAELVPRGDSDSPHCEKRPASAVVFAP